MTTLGLMTDPGLPKVVATAIADSLADQLSTEANSQPIEGVWGVEVSQETLPVTEQDTVPLMRRAERIREQNGWDYVVYLSDLPRRRDGQPMLCEVSSSAGAALVSLPAMGALRLRTRMRKLLARLIDALRDDRHIEDHEVIAGQHIRRRESGSGDAFYLVASTRLARLRLLAGMVRSNRPVRLLPALSSSVAAAIATGAFGIFYASVWNMADALHPLRLALISVLAVGVFTSWLIIRNGLWNNTSGSQERRAAQRDNFATAATITMSVILVYLVLHGVLFLAGLVVIASSYLESQLGHAVTIADYAKLSWLAASLGTMAGALGSNFDSQDSIREATYMRREDRRRELGETEGTQRDDDD